MRSDELLRFPWIRHLDSPASAPARAAQRPGAGAIWRLRVYLALGIRSDGTKEVLGLWMQSTEGAKFWLRVMTELHGRGVRDILFAVVDGLKGFAER